MDYTQLCAQIRALAEEEPHYVPLLSNASALIWHSMDRLNWAGFYLMRQGQLCLGPFQGKLACIHIPVGRGVCGAAVEKDATQRVPDVHAFPGHIACDGASRSEIVMPLHRMAASSACWISTARRPTAFPRTIRPGWRPSPARWRA